MLAAGDDKKAEFIATVTPMDLDAAKHAVANGAPAAENNEPVEWSRASARRCIAKLVANGDINTENDIKAEFIANGAPAAEKQEKTDDDAAPGKKIDQIVIDESDDDAEQPKDPKAFIHNKPEEIEIYRQLKPVFSAAEQKVLLFQHTGKTVCDYIEGVRESWSKYVGDVMHFQLGEEDMFFLVHSAEEYNGQTCLIISELTANQNFDCLLAITGEEIADMCVSDPPEVNIYQEGSIFDLAYHPRGVIGRQDIKDEIVCRRDIKEARKKGWLLPFFTRARGEGPYASRKNIKHSSLLTCTQPRDMHNPQFKLAVRQLQLENAYRELIRAQWLLPAKNASEAFKWSSADQFKPRSEYEMMDDSEQANEDFCRRVLKPMRTLLADFEQEVKDGLYKRDVEAEADGCEISAPKISRIDRFVHIFKLGLNKQFAAKKGPLYYVEGKNIVEGRSVITGKDHWPTTERSSARSWYKTKLDGICNGMSEHQLKEYEREQRKRYEDIVVASLREPEPVEGYGAIGMSVKPIDTHNGRVIDIKGDVTGHPVVPLKMNVDETVKVRLPHDATTGRDWNIRELQSTRGIELERSNDGEAHQIVTITASKKGRFEVELFYSHFVTAKSKPTITLSLMAFDPQDAGEGGSAKGGEGGSAKEVKKEDDKDKGDKRDGGRSVNDILNEHNQLDLRENRPNWVFVNMMRNMELEVLLPLHKHYDKVGWHWGKQRTESIEIVKHETYKEKDVEILTVKIKDNARHHWLSIVSNEHCDRTPDVVLEFLTYPPLPRPYTPKMTASARVAIYISMTHAPLHPKEYPATIGRGGFIVLRINARFVKQPAKGPDLHFIFAKDLDVTEEPWQLNDLAEDSWALGKFADGCVKLVTVTANDKLAAGTFPIKIYTIDPDDDSNAKERPHAIVNLTVKPSEEDDAAETGGSVLGKRKDDKKESEVSERNEQLSSYAAVLHRPNTYAKAMLMFLKDSGMEEHGDSRKNRKEKNKEEKKQQE